MSHTLPAFPSPDLGTQPLPERISMSDVKKLQTLYRDHCEVRSPPFTTLYQTHAVMFPDLLL